MAAALVMGLSPTGLHVVRALGRAGVSVTGMDEGIACGRFSRHLGRFVPLPPIDQRLAVLCSLCPERGEQEAGKPVLLATTDRDVAFICANADTLARHYALQQSYRDGTAARILDKQAFYRLCDAHGVAYPATWQTSAETVSEIGEKLRFPCIVKPSQIHRVKHLMNGGKVWIVRDRDELAALIRTIPPDAGALLAQEIVPGPESGISLYCAHVDRDGTIRQAFTASKLRQYPPGFGSASMAQSHCDPETARIAGDLLTAAGYRGIAALEFKRHSGDGKLYTIEMNPRPSLWFSLSQAAGRPVVLSAYRELAGLAQKDVAEQPQRDGVRWRDASKDMASALFYRRNPEFVLPPPDLTVAGRAVQHVGAVFERDDPRPVIGEVLNRMAKAVARSPLVGGRRNRAAELA
ncbi:MAG: hypothetical protein KDE55_23405 [Novosphingobium sp.]|nr:hypothetical protein [Novosphingobium sp.]